MSEATDPYPQREFSCAHCHGLIRVPMDLPPTTAPCPHCGKNTTSPALEVSVESTPEKPQEQLQPVFPSAQPSPSRDESVTSDAADQRSKQVAPSTATPPSRTPFLGAAVAIFFVVLIGAGTLAYFRFSDKLGRDEGPREVQNSSSQELETLYIRTGWKKEAFDTLEHFIAAKTVDERLAFVLDPERVAERMRAFYGDGPIDDSDTPAEAFSTYILPEGDRFNGIYMLVFDRPPQLEMRNFFRPVASLEIQYGLEEPDILLNSMALFSNFSMEPVRVHALFKKTDQGLKLDWETFSQTKHRKLREFIEAKELGKAEVFRVFIREDVPQRGIIAPDTRTYRISDPANSGDSAMVKVLLDTKIASKLAVLNWVGVQGATEHFRTATVELEWRPGDYEPYLTMKRFICWEYLGLGGQEDPSEKGSDQATSPGQR